MELSLRRRLAGVATVAISQTHQTAEIEFTAAAIPFSSADLRRALDASGLELVTLQVEACGGIEESASGRTLRLDPQRFLLNYAQALPAARVVCVTGTLDEGSEPATLSVAAVTSTSH